MDLLGANGITFVQQFSNPLLTLFFKAITYLGHPGVWFGFFAILFWLGMEKKANIGISALAFTVFLTGTLKSIIHEPRPINVQQLSVETSYAMPSGHGATIASAHVSLKENFGGNLIGYSTIALIVLVCLSRVYLGVHTPLQVIMGVFIGLITSKLVIKLHAKIKHRFNIMNTKEYLLLGTIILVSVIGGLFLPEEYKAAQAFAGYYFAYILLTHSKIIPQKIEWSKIILGSAIIGIAFFMALNSVGFEEQLFYFLGGFFVPAWSAINSLKAEKKNTKNKFRKIKTNKKNKNKKISVS
jgi:membrane-associated phospholipid phosphatase